jgi:cell shape-determining protein MreD
VQRHSFSFAGWLQTCVMLLLVLLACKITLPVIGTTLPVFPLTIAMYYWALFRDHYGYVWVIAILSLVQDLLLGLPMGCSAAALLSAHLLLLWVRRRVMMDHFVVIWICFVPVVIWTGVVTAALAGWAGGVQPGPWLQAAADDLLGTVLIFPLAYRLFHRLYKRHEQRNG